MHGQQNIKIILYRLFRALSMTNSRH